MLNYEDSRGAAGKTKGKTHINGLWKGRRGGKSGTLASARAKLKSDAVPSLVIYSYKSAETVEAISKILFD